MIFYRKVYANETKDFAKKLAEMKKIQLYFPVSYAKLLFFFILFGKMYKVQMLNVDLSGFSVYNNNRIMLFPWWEIEKLRFFKWHWIHIQMFIFYFVIFLSSSISISIVLSKSQLRCEWHRGTFDIFLYVSFCNVYKRKRYRAIVVALTLCHIFMDKINIHTSRQNHINIQIQIE